MKTIRTRMRYKNFELSLIFESVSDVVFCNDDNVFYVKSHYLTEGSSGFSYSGKEFLHGRVCGKVMPKML